MVKKIRLDKTITIRVEQDGTGIISFNGGVYSINEISCIVLNELGDDKTISTIVDMILNDYDVIYFDLKNDLNDFFLQLCTMGIITHLYLENTIKELNSYEQIGNARF